MNPFDDLIPPGNIDLTNRPQVKNSDGTTSTVRSFSANIDGREVLLPTVSDDGRNMSEDEAIDQYRRSGKHLGIFNSPDEATTYAKRLHDDQAAALGNPFADLVPEVTAPSGADAARAAATDEGGYRNTAAPESTLEYITGLAQKGAQGATFKWADEAAAGLGAIGGKLPGGHGKSRQQILDDIRAKEDVFTEQNPKAAMGAEIAGALGSGTAGGAALASRLPMVLPRLGGIGRTALGTGAAAVPGGALTGMGAIEGEASAGDYAAEAGKGAGIAGLVGGALGGAGATAARVVGPWATRAAQQLSDRGVRLTPGEVIGGRAARVEDGIASMPLIGDMVRRRAEEGVDSLNRVAYDDTLAPLGARYQGMFGRQGTRTGNESVDEIADILEHRYATVVPRMSAAIDQPLEAEARAIANRMPTSVRHEFVDAVERYVDSVLDPATGVIPGAGLQQSLRSLREASRRFTNSTAHPWHADLGQGLADLRTALEGSMARHSAPADVTRFNNINASYARYARIRDAASRVTSDEGVFSPANLHGAVRAGDRSAGKGRTAQGRALMQDLSGPARSVMKPKGAGSPSAERLGLIGAITQPALAAKTLAYGLPVAALYTRLGSRAFQRAATFSPHTREAIRRAMQRGAEMSAPGVGVGAENMAEMD